MRNYSTDEGGPLGTGLQEFVSNHLRSIDFVSEFIAVVNRGTYDRAIPHLASPYRSRH